METCKDGAYESSVPFGAAHVTTMCIMCSDGRFVAQTEEFLDRSLFQQASDHVVLPGGAACLAGHFAAWREAEVLAENMKFLLRVHDLKRVVLIAHEDCGFYSKRLGVGAGEMERRQLEDLHAAAERIANFASGVEVVAYYARISGGKVRFESVAV